MSTSTTPKSAKPRSSWLRPIQSNPERALRISAVLTMVGLALMVWSMIAPTPMPIMVAMTVGQGIGTLAFALYGYVVLMDLRRVRRERRESLQPPFGDAPSDAAPDESRP